MKRLHIAASGRLIGIATVAALLGLPLAVRAQDGPPAYGGNVPYAADSASQTPAGGSVVPLPPPALPTAPSPTLPTQPVSPPAPTVAPQNFAVSPQISQDAINAAVDRRLKEIEEAKKQQEAAQKAQAQQQGYEVGSDLSIKANYTNGLFLWLNTPNKDFTMHLGAWIQADNVWWNQSQALKAARGANAGPAQGIASGDTLGGIGDMQDGVFFRRIRPFAEGTFWEQGEYRIIIALENDQFQTGGLDEVWVGAKDLPVVGTVRFGHVKSPMGLEGDMTTSSRAMTFMERSSYSESIELNQNFVTGLWLSNNYFDQRATWSFAAFRTDPTAAGAFFGDGQWGWQGRLTALPFYEEDGRYLTHVGISGGWRNGTNNIANAPFAYNTVQLRARPELRDDVPAGGATNADSSRLIDTGIVALGSDYLMGLEYLTIHGPWSVQAEYGWNFVNDAVGIAPTSTGLHPALTPPQNYIFNGGYIQLAYMLTGENRSYDKRMGSLGREYLGKSGPYNRFWCVRGEDGHLCTNWGAWEVAVRYSYVNLNNGAGLNRIQGGIMDGTSVALNWYLNTNLTVNFDYVHDTRENLPAGSVPGSVDGFGTRVQFQF